MKLVIGIARFFFSLISFVLTFGGMFMALLVSCVSVMMAVYSVYMAFTTPDVNYLIITVFAVLAAFLCLSITEGLAKVATWVSSVI